VLLLVLTAACSTEPAALAGARVAPQGPLVLTPWRTVAGGFLAPPGTVFGAPARTGTGAYVKLIAPTAVALRDNDLLVLDSAAARLWRVDLALNTMSAVSGAPTAPGTSVALGPDLSAWVHDPGARQVLRFAKDGRLLQTFRANSTQPAMAGFTLADGGATLLVADNSQRQWIEFRPVGTFGTPVQPGGADGRGVGGVDALASTGTTVFVLDRSAGVVHVARRNGTLQGTLGQGELKQPVAIAADRAGRVFVIDAQDRAVKLLRPGMPALVLDAARLRVQEIGGIAVDERFLVVSDRLTGQVQIHIVQEPGRP